MRKHILARTRSLSRTVRTVDSVILPRTHKSTVGLDVNVGMCVFSTRVYICIYIHICECVQRNRNNKKKKERKEKTQHIRDHIYSPSTIQPSQKNSVKQYCPFADTNRRNVHFPRRETNHVSFFFFVTVPIALLTHLQIL